MVERTVQIGSRNGLHARPAKLFVQAVGESGAAVTVRKDGGDPVNGASLLSLMTQGITRDDRVTITVDGENEHVILEELAALLSSDHDQ